MKYQIVGNPDGDGLIVEIWDKSNIIAEIEEKSDNKHSIRLYDSDKKFQLALEDILELIEFAVSDLDNMSRR